MRPFSLMFPCLQYKLCNTNRWIVELTRKLKIYKNLKILDVDRQVLKVSYDNLNPWWVLLNMIMNWKSLQAQYVERNTFRIIVISVQFDIMVYIDSLFLWYVINLQISRELVENYKKDRWYHYLIFSWPIFHLIISENSRISLFIETLLPKRKYPILQISFRQDL